MRISYANVFDNYTPVVSSENLNYLGTNVQDSRLSKVWRTTALTSAYISVDCGTGKYQPTIGAIFNHNLTTGATIKLQGSSSSGFSVVVEKALARINTNCAIGFSTLASRRYWRFLVKDTGSTYSYMSVGRMWIGTYINVTIQNEIKEDHIDGSVYSLSYSRQHYGDEGEIGRGYDLQFPVLTTTGKTALDAFNTAVKKYKNFITIIDPADMTKITPVYGFKTNDISYDYIYSYQWMAKFRVEESK